MLQIAKILRSDNTDGGILVGSDYALDEFDYNEPIYIEFDGIATPFFILSCKARGKGYVLHLNDVTSLKDAEELVGRVLFADLTEEEEDSGYLGWKVYDVASATPASDTSASATPGLANGSNSGTSSVIVGCKSATHPVAPILLGQVVGDEPIPGNYCIWVRTDSNVGASCAGTEILIPLHEDLIIKEDPKHKELFLDLPVGLY